MTTKGKWVALMTFCGLLLALWDQHLQLAILAGMMLLWMFVAFLVFRIQCAWFRWGLKATRRIQERDGESGFLWAGRQVPVELTLESRGRIPKRLVIRDQVPPLFAPATRDPAPSIDTASSHSFGRNSLGPSTAKIPFLSRCLRSLNQWITAVPDRDHPPFDEDAATTPKLRAIRYWVRPLAAGHAILPGVRLELRDAWGWYRYDDTLECRQRIHVLPAYREGPELRSLLKNQNAIPHHGIHRQRRPGMGFELLELREYRDGDPPKSIAWKASARRETWMTRQYETEIPIRIHLIVEGTIATRIGSFGHRTLDQINSVATSIARIATQHGDWVGACLLDGQQELLLPAAAGDKGFYRIAQNLSRFSSQAFPQNVGWSESLQSTAFAFASEYYPRWLRPAINPTGLSWFDGLGSATRRQHVQLANLLAHRYRLSIQEHAAMLADTQSLAPQLQRFLMEHGHEWQSPMIAANEIKDSFAHRDWRPIASAIQRSVLRAKDNEVYVLFVDMLGTSRPLSELLDALKMAKARHHRVVVISTSPHFERPESIANRPLPSTAEELRQFSDRVRSAETADTVRRSMRELGIPFSISATEETIGWILAEVELARSGRFTPTGARS
ncbi:DUF58 domain-containing protein [Pirellulaceae bacterium SH467]|jgi:uncharacterized protein (DUF58 family)